MKIPIEQEENAKEHEANRITDLRERCEKRNLDIEAENKKYLDKIARKEARKSEKSTKKNRLEKC